ncbi:MAG: ATP-binding protein [Elusimicrobia bacterium]|nr:ATP-binding protein [Elusimicrobiota bacterium]
MTGVFVNREKEFAALERVGSSGGLVILYGRRRIGKTRLLVQWLARRQGLYAQAIEGNALLQLDQVFQDLQSGLQAPVAPRTWDDFFSILDHHKGRLIFCLDEFPYLVAADPTLPSRLQRWWDHRAPKDLLLVLCGSSRRMMHSALLDETAPLYGRSRLILNIGPMHYLDFCRALSLRKDAAVSFELFSMVGGIPKYWELVGSMRTPIQAAEALYFGYASYMENEPRRLLMDEQLSAGVPISVLEAVGRGAHKPSEIASRLGVPQTQMAKALYALLDCGFLCRDIPLGQSQRNPKNVLYRIADPALRFWYQVYSPHKSRWRGYPAAEKKRLLCQHASTVFEDYVRGRLSGAGRYWEKVGEFDLVRPVKEGLPPDQGVIVSEVKFRSLGAAERSGLLRDMQERWRRTEASRRWPARRFEIIDADFLR